MGMTYYGRTYKLADPACSTMTKSKCTGPGAPGECTASEGALSKREIRAMLKDGGYTPNLNKTAMVKYMTYTCYSCVGHDDSETIAMKEGFASSLCLGGTMVWSVDFDADAGASGGSTGGGSGSPGTNLIWVRVSYCSLQQETRTDTYVLG